MLPFNKLKGSDCVQENGKEGKVTVAVRTNRYSRWEEGRRRLIGLYKKTRNLYGVGAYFDPYKQRICKDSLNKKSIRQLCNRRFRRRMNRWQYGIVQNGGSYRKYEDYWYTII